MDTTMEERIKIANSIFSKTSNKKRLKLYNYNIEILLFFYFILLKYFIQASAT